MDLSDFAKLIRRKRLSKGLTQCRLAELLCVSNSAVSKWENCVCFPDLFLFDDISKILEIPKTELLAYVSGSETFAPIDECYTGVLAKEMLRDDSVLDDVEITNVGLQYSLICGKREIRYATCIEIRSDMPDFPKKLSAALCEDGCVRIDHCAVKNGKMYDPEHLLVLPDTVFSYRINEYDKISHIKSELLKRGFSEFPISDPFAIFQKRGRSKK